MNQKEKTFYKNTHIDEFELINGIKSLTKTKHKDNIKGIDDDAAISKYGDKYLAISTDIFTEGIHFDLTYTPLKHLGYKCVVANISDITAMNVLPKNILISLAVSSKINKEHVMDFYKGVFLACENYNLDLIGGDTSSSLTGFTVSVTIFGDEKNKNQLVYRNTAKEGDIIFVTGDFGAAYLGLQILEREKKIFLEHPESQPNLNNYDYVVGRQLKPEARTDIVDFFKKNKITPTSMIDVSDGLSSEILHICKSSDVGCDVHLKKIPIHEESIKVSQELGIDETTSALNGGEDYELVFTANPKHLNVLLNQGFSSIGVIKNKKDGCNIILENNDKTELKPMGWSNKL